MKRLLLCGILTLFSLSSALASDLLDIYSEALENDPVFKIAYSSYMSSTENIPQARAALYPQLTLNAQAGRAYEDFLTNQTLANAYYGVNQWQVTASQAVFNYKAWALVQKAKASVKANQATFNDAAQNLILRTAAAYFNVLLSEDALQFSEAKLRANKRQLDQAKQRLEVGLDTITSFYEAQAAYDQSISEVIGAKNNRLNQKENLRQLTNHIYEAVSPLRNSAIPLIKLEPVRVEEWVDTGLKQNYSLLAAKYNLQQSRENMKALSAGGWPSLAIQGNANQVHNQLEERPNIVLPARTSNANVVLALNFPVFQGGLVQAQTRQAQYDFQTSSQQLEQNYRNTVVSSRIAFNNIVDGNSKVKADRQSIISAKNSLESTEAQFQAGTRTMVDVVNAQQNLFQVQLQLATDQYNLINALLRLKYLAGTLNVADLEQVNAWLATTRINKRTPLAQLHK